MKKEDRRKREKGKKGKRERKGRRAPRTCLRHAVSALRFGEGSIAPTGLGFLFYFADAGFEGLQGEVGLLFVDHERRREADGVCAGSYDQQGLVEGQIDDGIAQVGGFFL